METPEQIAEKTNSLISEILHSLGFEASVETTSCSEEEICYMITSPDSRFIIGDGGSRLDDLQHIVKLRASVWIAITTATAPRNAS